MVWRFMWLLTLLSNYAVVTLTKYRNTGQRPQSIRMKRGTNETYKQKRCLQFSFFCWCTAATDTSDGKKRIVFVALPVAKTADNLPSDHGSHFYFASFSFVPSIVYISALAQFCTNVWPLAIVRLCAYIFEMWLLCIRRFESFDFLYEHLFRLQNEKWTIIIK